MTRNQTRAQQRASKRKSFNAKVVKRRRWIEGVLGDRLEPADEPLVEMAAKLMVIEAELSDQLGELGGDYLTQDQVGNPKPAVEIVLWRDVAKQLQSLSNRLGLNPVARKEHLRVERKKKVEAKDDFDASLD